MNDRTDPPARPVNPQELQNPLDFVRAGLAAAKGGAPQVFVWAGGSIIGTAAMVMPAFIGAGRAGYAVTTFIVAAVAVVALTWLGARRASDLDVLRRWRVVQQPLAAETLDALREQLRTVHALACKAFAEAVPKSRTRGKVRANIFLVDYRRAPEGVGCELRMPAQLRVRMGDPKEWELAFQPGWGATGEAFRSAQPVITTDRLYAIPAPLQGVFDALISRRLKGLISLPIRDGRHVIGVLNIDIVEEDGGLTVKTEQLTQVYDGIRKAEEVRAIGDLLAEADKAWLSIGLRREPRGAE